MSGFFTGPRIAWGTGAVEQLSGLQARRAIVVADPAVAGQEGFRRVVEELEKSETSLATVTADPGPPTVEHAQALARRFTAFGPDWIVAVGGGSVIDLAKTARALFETPGLAAESLTPLAGLPHPSRARLVAVPTTSGRGSEASWSALLLNADGDPVEPMHRDLVPYWALVDPAFAGGMPPGVALEAGVQPLAHAIEAYVSAWSNPFSDPLALDAAAGAFQALPALERWDDAETSRARLHYCATTAGLAASNAQLGLAHALAAALVEPTGLSYGRLLGMALVPTLAFNYGSARDRFATISAAFAAASSRSSAEPRTAARPDEAIRTVLERLGFADSLRRARLPEERMLRARERVVHRVVRSTAALSSPRVPTADEVGLLLDALIGGGEWVPP